MTEAIHILKDVPNAICGPKLSCRQSNSQLIRPSPWPQKQSRIHKRQMLDRFSGHLATRQLPGAEQALAYLYSKYIRNLSVHTIRQTSAVVLSFLQFLHDDGITIFTLTRGDIGAFVKFEQDQGLQPVSIIGYLRALYAFLAFLVMEEILPHEIMERKIRLSWRLPGRISYGSTD